MLEELLGDMSPNGERRPAPAEPHRDEGPHVSVYEKQADQAHLILGVPSYRVDHPDRYALQLLSTVLGGHATVLLWHALQQFGFGGLARRARRSLALAGYTLRRLQELGWPTWRHRTCAAVVADSAAALGGLDGVVLNVGIGLGRGMAGTSAAQWDQTFAVNTRAHFLVAAAALEALEPGSAIVFISSAASLRAATGIPAYDASKAALLGICRQVAREGMTRGIRANLVVPSLVDTPLGREASRLNPGRTARRLPFGRQATAWEVAYATVWLLSGESSYVNAHPLVVTESIGEMGLDRVQLHGTERVGDFGGRIGA